MTFNVFTIPASGGSNANSGTSPSVVYTTSGATWDGTSQITGITGAGAVQVGDWVNINGAYIAQVTVASATALTLSTTAKYGTAPSAGSYTITDGGYFASVAIFASVFGSATVYADTCFQIQNGASGTTLSGALTIHPAGSTTAQVWLRGYNTTPGDLDSGSASLTYCTWTCGANMLTLSGAYTTISGMSFGGSGTTGVLTLGAAVQRLRHCRSSTTASNSGATAVTINSGPVTLDNCYFSGVSTNNAIVSTAFATTIIVGCTIAGAGSGTTQVGIASQSTLTVLNSTIEKTGSYGISQTAASMIQVFGNTFTATGNDAIHATVALTNTSVVSNNLFRNTGTNGSGYDINNASGTVSGNIQILPNDSYNPSSGHLNGFGSLGELGAVTESADPCVSSSNLALVNTALGYQTASGNPWENVSGQQSYLSFGAWQIAGGGGGGGPVDTNFRGGFEN